MIVRVDPRYPGVWDTLQGYLASAIERGDGGRDWETEDIRTRAESGLMELWAFVQDDEVIGALATCQSYFPKRKVLEVLAFGCAPGHESVWQEDLLHLQEMARSVGAQALVGTGRPGWVRKLPVTRYRYVWEIDLWEQQQSQLPAQ